MASNNHNTTLFAIFVQPHICSYLALSPQNYQTQFRRFLQENNFSREQALSLKTQIQKSLSDRTRQIKSQQHTRPQAPSKQEKNGKAQSNLVLMSTPTQTQNSSEGLLKRSNLPTQQHEKYQKISHSSDRIEQNQQNQRAVVPDVEKPNRSSRQYNKKETGRQDSHIILCNRQPNIKFETAGTNSPRFKNGGEVDCQQTRNFIANIDKEDQQEDVQPRQFPQMSPHHTFCIGASSAESNKAKKVNDSRLDVELAKSEVKNEEINKKFVLLQNCPAFKQSRNGKSNSLTKGTKSKSSKQISDVFKRISETPTISFQMKNMQEINTKEEKQYLQTLNYAVTHPPRVQVHQDLSKKTTQSFCAKGRPEINSQEAKQLQDYEISFSEHLRAKQLIHKSRESHQKINEAKPKLNGSRCESKIFREMLMKKESQLEQKMKQIKTRIEQEKRLNIHRDLSKKSVSPASNSNLKSRECPSCSPKQQKVGYRKSGGEVPSYEIKGNKKYVSNVLKQSYAQFSREAKKG